MDGLPDRRFRTLMHVVKRINTSMDLEETLSLIMGEAKHLMDSEAGSLLLVDQETRELYFNIATGGQQDILRQIRVPAGKGIAGIVAATGESLIVNDAEHDPRIFKGVDEKTRITTRNLMAVPLEVKGRVIGVLEVINRISAEGYGREDLQLLECFADFAALAVNNRDLFDKVQNKVYEAHALYRLSASINYCASVEELLRENISIVSEVMGAKRVSIITRHEEDLTFMSAVGIQERIMRSEKVIMGHVLEFILKTGAGVFTSDISNDERFSLKYSERYRDRSFIAVPLKLRNQIVAFLCVTERQKRQPYQYADLHLLEMLGQQIVENYSHFRLSEEFKRKQVLEAELSVASRIQQDILPREFPTDGLLDIAARNVPAKMVGGDFYDFLPLGNGRFGFVIADVSGKGVPAGLFMTVSRSIIRMCCSDLESPARALESANRHICDESRSGMFVTCFCGIVDTGKKEIVYTNAGHGLQFIVRQEDPGIESLPSTGIPLGVIHDQPYTNREVRYHKGDVLFLYTDGLTEAINSRSEQYGEKRLKAFLSTSANRGSACLVQALLADVAAFQGETEPFDDITLMAVTL
jgi:sigma-B regulation protein RsbU (phosphoserine phosphatase)